MGIYRKELWSVPAGKAWSLCVSGKTEQLPEPDHRLQFQARNSPAICKRKSIYLILLDIHRICSNMNRWRYSLRWIIYCLKYWITIGTIKYFIKNLRRWNFGLDSFANHQLTENCLNWTILCSRITGKVTTDFMISGIAFAIKKI